LQELSTVAAFEETRGVRNAGLKRCLAKSTVGKVLIVTQALVAEQLIHEERLHGSE
jgi:hypothetical protein